MPPVLSIEQFSKNFPILSFTSDGKKGTRVYYVTAHWLPVPPTFWFKQMLYQAQKHWNSDVVHYLSIIFRNHLPTDESAQSRVGTDDLFLLLPVTDALKEWRNLRKHFNIQFDPDQVLLIATEPIRSSDDLKQLVSFTKENFAHSAILGVIQDAACGIDPGGVAQNRSKTGICIAAVTDQLLHCPSQLHVQQLEKSDHNDAHMLLIGRDRVSIQLVEPVVVDYNRRSRYNAPSDQNLVKKKTCYVYTKINGNTRMFLLQKSIRINQASPKTSYSP
mmetsp:Transcript_14009/g.21084  ORF Transcript_14009/g.21084 Transcript_14009/m.21084 type:complete len:275 (-) Transcript_14009:2395-3219(-)